MMPFLAASIRLADLQFATLVAAKKSTPSSTSDLPLLILLLVFVGVYFLFLRPQRNRLRQQQQVQNQADVGDEVITGSGIVGRIRRFEGDRAELEIAPGTTIWIIRQAIGRRVSPPPPVVSDDTLASDSTIDLPGEHGETSGHADRATDADEQSEPS